MISPSKSITEKNGGALMTARNLKTRIKKLEASRKHIDEMLVVWRLPGTDVSEALDAA